MQHNFVYPAGSNYDGIEYSGLEFNFVEIKTNYFDDRTAFLENEGEGIDIYGGVNPITGNSKIARIKSSNTVNVKKENGSIELEFNETIIGGKSVGNQDSNTKDIYTGVSENKIHIRRIGSTDNTVDVSIDENGSIDLKVPTVKDASIKQFYVNANYDDLDGNGSIMRPYKYLTKAMAEVIGNGTVVNPQYPRSIIYLLTDVVVEQWEFEQVYGHKLENRLSVNTLTLASADDIMRTITYNGSDIIDYPFSLKFLTDKDLQRGGAGNKLSQNISFIFNNLQLVSNTTLGVVHALSYDGHGISDGSTFTSSATLKKVRLLTNYKKDDNNTYKQLYTNNNSPILLYGRPVLGQDSISVNSNPVLMLEGLGNTGVGTHILFDISFFNSSNTSIGLKRTTVDLQGLLTFEIDTHRLPVNSTMRNNTIKGGYAPKSGLNFINNDSSHFRVEQYIVKGSYITIIEDGIYYPIGGYDSFMNFSNVTGSTDKYAMYLSKGDMLVGRFNYLIKVEGQTKPTIDIKNCDFGNAFIDKMALYQTIKGTDYLYIVVENSTMNNVKSDVISNMQLFSSKTTVNGYDYSRKPSYGSDGEAITAGLIVGNIYYNHSTATKAMKRIE